MQSTAAYLIFGDYGPFDGGCLEAARAALPLARGAELWATGPLGAPPDHVFLRHQGLFWDADGAHTLMQMERKVRRDGHRGRVPFHTRSFADCPHSTIPDDPEKIRKLRALLLSASSPAEPLTEPPTTAKTTHQTGNILTVVPTR